MAKPIKSRDKPIHSSCYENPAFTISYPSTGDVNECIVSQPVDHGSKSNSSKIHRAFEESDYKTENTRKIKDGGKFGIIGKIRKKFAYDKTKEKCNCVLKEFTESGKHDENCPKSGKLEPMTQSKKSLLPTNGFGEHEKFDKNEESGEMEKTGKTVPERETWGKKLDFMLSVIGFAVDLGNVWRFPYICYKNGGGAFLIPYFVMLIFLGMPLFYMELALGQYQRCGAISVWQRICPMFSGIGYGICLVATFVGMYYNTVIAWSVYYLFASFTSELPWTHCNNSWNTPNCISVADGYNKSAITNNSMLASAEYYLFNVLEIQKSTGIDNIGSPKWELVLCLFGTFVVIYFCLWRGIKSSGKAVWVTATLPYVVLFVLLIRGCTLPGAGTGILYYVKPQWHRLADIHVWLDAAAQIFFSLGPGFGTLLALSSYNKFHNNCYFDAIITSIINCLTSVLAGFVVFSILGYMAHVQGRDVDKVAIEGPGLVFIVYPEAVASLTGSVFWSIIFFLMLITLGLDSTFGGLEAVITGVLDSYGVVKNRRELFVLGLVCYCFLGALSTTTYGGQFVINLLDRHSAPISLLFICFIEAIAVNWFYGVQRFSNDIRSMLGYEPGIFWKVCWVGISPVCLIVLFILSIWAYEGLFLDTYVYPGWSVAVGWCITCSSLICIPIYIVYKFIIIRGTLKQKLMRMIKPTEVPDHVRNNIGVGGYDCIDISKAKYSSDPGVVTSNITYFDSKGNSVADIKEKHLNGETKCEKRITDII